MKRHGYPYNPDTEQYFCSACWKVIPAEHEGFEANYHRCPFCAFDFAPFGVSLRVVNITGGIRL